uniref:Uncharacterized protein MANES_13G109700 n=1 Tax=Rhizophora mucronata TaxID=61149 RepID=A0A2P2KJY1_RHIMU
MWLARSIANSVKLDDGDGNGRGNNDADDVNFTDSKSTPRPEPEQHSQSTSPSSTTTVTTPRGVKEDISELTKSFTRQLWGVASFLAPPPDSSTPPPNPAPPPHPQISDVQTEPQRQSDLSESPNEEDPIAGIRSDFAEIGGKFKSGISKLSSNKAVSDITKIASNFLQFGSESDFSGDDLIGSAVGVTEEVVAFARDIAMHPETWLDFPVSDDNNFEEFDMSDVQQDHALAVEHLAPELAALRIELCPGFMSEGCFWKIYFVLLHPKLSKTDALLLSTPQVLETRAMLSHELQKRTKARPATNWSNAVASRSNDAADLSHEVSLSMPHRAESDSVPVKISSSEIVPPIVVAKTSVNEDFCTGAELEMDKHPVQSTEIKIIDKVVVEDETINETKHQHSSSTSSRVLDEKFEDDAEDWLKEESLEMIGASGNALSLNNDEDVSFSDLEEDDGDVAATYKKGAPNSDTARKDSRDWVQLGRSSGDSVRDVNIVNVNHSVSEQIKLRMQLISNMHM